MATLEELMSEVMDQGSVKTASRRGGEQDDLAALAAELGTDLFFDKEAEEKDKEEEEAEDEERFEEMPSKKQASLYAQLYPEAAGNLNKVASQNKLASYQHEMGRATYHTFQAHVSDLIEKTAADIITGAIKIDSPKGKMNRSGNVHEAVELAQQSATDKPKNSGKAIDTSTMYIDETAPVNDERVVGHYEAVRDPQTQKVAELALRKAFLLANLED